jgi:hypothetical protein
LVGRTFGVDEVQIDAVDFSACVEKPARKRRRPVCVAYFLLLASTLSVISAPTPCRSTLSISA